MNKPEINIVWLKRDLRLRDHEPMHEAIKSNLPILILYIFEPSVMAAEDSDIRHWRFVYESLTDMQAQLEIHDKKIYIFHDEVSAVFTSLISLFNIKAVFSHQETGIGLTFQRDKNMSIFFKKHGIWWREFQSNGVIRGLKSRNNWNQLWEKTMNDFEKSFEISSLNTVSIDTELYQTIKGMDLDDEIKIRNSNFQPGGESWAWKYLSGFIKDRYVSYGKNISSPSLSRKSCSRLSPYLAYGNVSMRMVYQYTMKQYPISKNKRALSQFISRLHWHCHFIQKFESECRYEFENINRGFNSILKIKNEEYIDAWQKGQTGIPIIDACMRCVAQTGYLNFRMRAMVVSFFTYNLWQDWRDLHFLARQFLDYEPGIHYPQLQMQSGTTGVNTIRIYNPIKNALSHDKDGEFVKKWVPELKHVPADLVHEPYKLTEMEQRLFQCELGVDYPFPIVDVEKTRKAASDIMWNSRKSKLVQSEAQRILKVHTHIKEDTDE